MADINLHFPPLRKKYGKKGGIISAVDLLNGIARCAGMEVISVPGATGYLDTDYDAKARYALDAIKRLDFVYLHIEAPDEAGHLGSVEEKVKAIERVDGVVGTIRDQFDGVLAVLPDHPTPIRVQTHTRDPVPFVVVGKGTDAKERYSEAGRPVRRFGNNECNGILRLPLFIKRGWHQSPASSRISGGNFHHLPHLTRSFFLYEEIDLPRYYQTGKIYLFIRK